MLPVSCFSSFLFFMIVMCVIIYQENQIKKDKEFLKKYTKIKPKIRTIRNGDIEVEVFD